MILVEKGRRIFREREAYGFDLIKNYIPEAIEIGVFGSYARNEHTMLSDIDFYVICDCYPSRDLTCELRDVAEEHKIDIVFMSKNYFDNEDTLLIRNIKRDRRILHER